MYPYEHRIRAVEIFIKLGMRVMASIRRLGYRWAGWLSRMSETNLTRSMFRKVCSPDNSAREEFFGD